MKNHILFIAFLFITGHSVAQEFSLGCNIYYNQLKGEGPADFADGYYSGGSTYTVDYPDFQIFEAKGAFLNFQGNLSFDYNPVTFSNDKIGLGINCNFACGYFISPKFEGIDNAFSIDIPQYIMLRFGSSGVKNDDGLGAGIGLGYNYQLIPIRLGVLNTQLEFEYRDYIFRINYDLQKKIIYNYYSSEGFVPAITFRQIGLQVAMPLRDFFQ